MSHYSFLLVLFALGSLHSASSVCEDSVPLDLKKMVCHDKKIFTVPVHHLRGGNAAFASALVDRGKMTHFREWGEKEERVDHSPLQAELEALSMESVSSLRDADFYTKLMHLQTPHKGWPAKFRKELNDLRTTISLQWPATLKFLQEKFDRGEHPQEENALYSSSLTEEEEREEQQYASQRDDQHAPEGENQADAQLRSYLQEFAELRHPPSPPVAWQMLLKQDAAGQAKAFEDAVGLDESAVTDSGEAQQHEEWSEGEEVESARGQEAREKLRDRIQSLSDQNAALVATLRLADLRSRELRAWGREMVERWRARLQLRQAEEEDEEGAEQNEEDESEETEEKDREEGKKEGRKGGLRRRCRALKRELREAERRHAQARATLEGMSARNDSITAAHAQLALQVSRLAREKDALAREGEAAVGVVEGKVQAALRELRGVKAEHTRNLQRVTGLERALAEAHNSTARVALSLLHAQAELKAQEREAGGKMRAQEQRERHMEAQVGEAKAGRAATSRALSAVSAERDATLQRLNQVMMELSKEREASEGLQGRMRELNNTNLQLRATSRHMETASRSMLDRQRAAEAQRQTAQRRAEEAREHGERWREEAREMLAGRERSEGEVEGLLTERTSLHAQLAHEQRRVEAEESRSREGHSVTASLLDSRCQLLAKVGELVEEARGLRQFVLRARQRRAMAETKTTELKSRVSALVEDRAAFDRDMQRVKAEAAELGCRIAAEQEAHKGTKEARQLAEEQRVRAHEERKKAEEERKQAEEERREAEEARIETEEAHRKTAAVLEEARANARACEETARMQRTSDDDYQHTLQEMLEHETRLRVLGNRRNSALQAQMRDMETVNRRQWTLIQTCQGREGDASGVGASSACLSS